MKSYRVLLVSIATIFTSMADASDFRVLNFGAACNDIVALESTLGSAPFEGKLPSGYQFAVKVREMDREALAVYGCKDGKFFRGAYIFDVKDGDEATQVYSVIKRRVTKEFGAPDYDFASAQHRRKMKEIGAELSKVDTEVAFWKTTNAEAHASVGEPTKDHGWRVSLSYTALSSL